MRQVFSKGRGILLAVLLLLGGLGGAAWVYRTELTCWICLRGLAAAGKDDRDGWIHRLAALDTAAVPGLLDQLGGDNVPACANAEAALAYLAHQWGADDARTVDVARQLAARFADFRAPGQEAALEWQLAQLPPASTPPIELTEAANRLLAAAMPSTEPGVRQRTLALGSLLLEFTPLSCLTACRELAQRGLHAPEPLSRTQALHLVLHPDLQKDTALLKEALPLLKDSDTTVRRAAVLAVGLARSVIAVDDLLPLLHDQDKEVRRLCELALKQRDLSENQILMGKLITDPRPLARMKILEELPYATDLDPGVWLQRLSQDPTEAVRAAAVRAMISYPIASLRARLQQMAQADPSPTVRQIAGYYLTLEQ